MAIKKYRVIYNKKTGGYISPREDIVKAESIYEAMQKVEDGCFLDYCICHIKKVEEIENQED